MPMLAPPVAGAYTLDKAHASLVFSLSHLGLSHYTAQFERFDARLQFDPARPTASTVTATVDVASLKLPSPPEGFTATLLGAQWLDAKAYPEMRFRSTKVEALGAQRLRITGDFTLHGVTQPVVLNATYNGGYAGHAMEPNARAGFSARGSFKRSTFGIANGVPPPGSSFGLGDNVEFAIEAEFSGPPLRK